MQNSSLCQRLRCSLALTLGCAMLLSLLPQIAFAASTWNPTLLVNTESFQTIDEGDSTTNIQVRFGQTLLKTLTYNRSTNRFQFSDGLSVVGSLSGSSLNVDRNATIGGNLSATGSVRAHGNLSGASLTVDKNASISGALLVKGNIASKAVISGAQLTFMNSGTRSYFLGNLSIGKTGGNAELDVSGTVSGSVIYAARSLRSSGSIVAEGAISGATITAGSQFDGAGLTSCSNGTTSKLLWDSSAKRFSCGADQNGQWSSTGALQLQFDNRYVNTSGDTMTGALTVNVTNGAIGTLGINVINAISGAVIHAEKTLTSSGNLVVKGAIKGKGNISGASLTIDNNASISGALLVKGNIKGKSNISGSTLTVDGNTTLHGQTYVFPTSQSANSVLKTDGAGNLTWSASVLGSGSGNILSFHPQYPNSVYFASGSASVGQLSESGGSAGREQVYRWTSSKSAANDYWIGVRVRVPDNFSSWINSAQRKPLELRYRTGSGTAAASYVNVKMLDTAGTVVPLTGGSNLANTAYTTASITGPDAAGTFTKGGYFNVLIKLAASTTQSISWFAEAGFLNFNWLTTAP